MKTLLFVTAAFLQVANILATHHDTYLCAAVGYQAGNDSFITTSDGGYPACSSLCFSQSDCQSFAWSSTECNLYNVPVAGNFNLDKSSPYYFYDSACETAHRICGTAGYQQTFDSYCWSNNTSPSTCASNCKNDAGCKSYAFGNGECSLYAEPVTGNVGGQDSPYTFYDVACAGPSSSATTTTVQSTTKSSNSMSSSTSKAISTTTKTTLITSTSTAKISSSTPVTTTTTLVKSTTKSSTIISPSTSKTSTSTTKTTASTSLTTTKASSTTKTASTTPKPTTSTTRVTTTSKTSTSASTSQSPSSTAICGLPGYEAASNFMSSYNGDSYNDCLADCKAQPTCKSFSFATSNNACNLYDQPVAAVSRYNVISPYHFYDADCTTAYKVCNVAAWDFQFQAYWDAWAGYTADSCAAACVADTACRSFASGNGECHFYFVPVTGNINAQPASPYSFSDVTCVGGS